MSVLAVAHAPAPWTLAEVVDGGIKHLCPVDANGYSVLTVVHQDGTPFAAVYSEVDARLMSAAPELLAALRDCLLFLDCDMPATASLPERSAARAAIAKATGAAA